MQGAFLDFLIELLVGSIELYGIFIENVVMSDPLSAIIWLVGALLTTFSIATMGYMALGGLGLPLPHLGRGHGERID